MISEDIIFLNTQDNEKIAVWKISNNDNDVVDNIFLTHGTFSDKTICLGIANYLAIKGYCCYIMEWRNHGQSPTTKTKYNFETIALYDINRVFSYLFKALKLKSIHCITHSGGGIALTLFLINHRKHNPKINSITMFACQAFGAAISSKNKIKILFSKYLTFLIGFIPAKTIGIGPHNESYYTMKQWFDWNLKKNFYSTDRKIDYKINMANVRTPVYSICSKGDAFIAPSSGCEIFLRSFKNSKNVLMVFSKDNGNLENYNHSRIILSRNAAKEIWPSVLKWIQKNHKNSIEQ